MFWDLAGQEYTGADPFNTTTIGTAVTNAGSGGWIAFLNEAYNGTPGVNAGAVTPAAAATAWDTLRSDSRVISNNIRLISPATTNTAGAQTWMQQFLNDITTKPPDAMAAHCYAGGDPNQIFACIRDTEARYPNIPIWVTEWGWVCPSGTCADSDIENFMLGVAPTFERDPNIQAYMWFFMGPQGTTAFAADNISLYDNSGVVRAIGTYYNTNWP